MERHLRVSIPRHRTTRVSAAWFGGDEVFIEKLAAFATASCDRQEIESRNFTPACNAPAAS